MDPLARDCVGQILRGDPRASEPEEIQLPGDRRVLRALPGERVIETVTGQEVDITQFKSDQFPMSQTLSLSLSLSLVFSFVVVVAGLGEGRGGGGSVFIFLIFLFLLFYFFFFFCWMENM